MGVKKLEYLLSDRLKQRRIQPVVDLSIVSDVAADAGVSPRTATIFVDFANFFYGFMTYFETPTVENPCPQLFGVNTVHLEAFFERFVQAFAQRGVLLHFVEQSVVNSPLEEAFLHKQEFGSSDVSAYDERMHLVSSGIISARKKLRVYLQGLDLSTEVPDDNIDGDAESENDDGDVDAITIQLNAESASEADTTSVISMDASEHTTAVINADLLRKQIACLKAERLHAGIKRPWAYLAHLRLAALGVLRRMAGERRVRLDISDGYDDSFIAYKVREATSAGESVLGVLSRDTDFCIFAGCVQLDMDVSSLLDAMAWPASAFVAGNEYFATTAQVAERSAGTIRLFRKDRRLVSELLEVPEDCIPALAFLAGCSTSYELIQRWSSRIAGELRGLLGDIPGIVSWMQRKISEGLDPNTELQSLLSAISDSSGVKARVLTAWEFTSVYYSNDRYVPHVEAYLSTGRTPALSSSMLKQCDSWESWAEILRMHQRVYSKVQSGAIPTSVLEFILQHRRPLSFGVEGPYIGLNDANADDVTSAMTLALPIYRTSLELVHNLCADKERFLKLEKACKFSCDLHTGAPKLYRSSSLSGCLNVEVGLPLIARMNKLRMLVNPTADDSAPLPPLHAHTVELSPHQQVQLFVGELALRHTLRVMDAATFVTEHEPTVSDFICFTASICCAIAPQEADRIPSKDAYRACITAAELPQYRCPLTLISWYTEVAVRLTHLWSLLQELSSDGSDVLVVPPCNPDMFMLMVEKLASAAPPVMDVDAIVSHVDDMLTSASRQAKELFRVMMGSLHEELQTLQNSEKPLLAIDEVFTDETCDTKVGSSGSLRKESNIIKIPDALHDAVGGSVPLPIARQCYEILEKVALNSVVIINSDTGDGKTTQVPQYILAQSLSSLLKRTKKSSPSLDGFLTLLWGDKEPQILVTEPRIVAAVQAAHRVRHEMGERQGVFGKRDATKVVGYMCSTDKDVGTSINFATAGYTWQRLCGIMNQLDMVVTEDDAMHNDTSDVSSASAAYVSSLKAPDSASAAGMPVAGHMYDLLQRLGTHLIIDELHERNLDTEPLVYIVIKLLHAELMHRCNQIIEQLDSLQKECDEAAIARILADVLMIWANRTRVVLMSATLDARIATELQTTAHEPVQKLKRYLEDKNDLQKRLKTTRVYELARKVEGVVAEGANICNCNNRSVWEALRLVDESSLPTVSTSADSSVVKEIVYPLDNPAIIETLRPLLDEETFGPLQDSRNMLNDRFAKVCEDGVLHSQRLISGWLGERWRRLGASLLAGRMNATKGHKVGTTDAAIVFLSGVNAIEGMVECVKRCFRNVQTDRPPLIINGDVLCSSLNDHIVDDDLCFLQDGISDFFFRKSAKASTRELLQSCMNDALSNCATLTKSESAYDRIAKDFATSVCDIERACVDDENYYDDDEDYDDDDENWGSAAVVRGTRAKSHRTVHHTTVSAGRTAEDCRNCAIKVIAEYPKVFIMPFFSGSRTADKLKVIEKIRQRVEEGDHPALFSGASFIFCATNIAESSITLRNVHTVIDYGEQKDLTASSVDGRSSLQAKWISQAQARQRAGRTGRMRTEQSRSVHWVIRMYPRSFFDLLPRYPVSALKQYLPAKLALQLIHVISIMPIPEGHSRPTLRKFLSDYGVMTQDNSDIDEGFINTVVAACNQLHKLQYIESPDDTPSNAVTPVGKLTISLSLDPVSASILLSCWRFGYLPQGIVMAVANNLMLSRYESLFQSIPAAHADTNYDGETKDRYLNALRILLTQNGRTLNSTCVYSDHIVALQMYAMLNSAQATRGVNRNVLKGLRKHFRLSEVFLNTATERVKHISRQVTMHVNRIATRRVAEDVYGDMEKLRRPDSTWMAWLAPSDAVTVEHLRLCLYSALQQDLLFTDPESTVRPTASLWTPALPGRVPRDGEPPLTPANLVMVDVSALSSEAYCTNATLRGCTLPTPSVTPGTPASLNTLYESFALSQLDGDFTSFACPDRARMKSLTHVTLHFPDPNRAYIDRLIKASVQDTIATVKWDAKAVLHEINNFLRNLRPLTPPRFDLDAVPLTQPSVQVLALLSLRSLRLRYPEEPEDSQKLLLGLLSSCMSAWRTMGSGQGGILRRRKCLVDPFFRFIVPDEDVPLHAVAGAISSFRSGDVKASAVTLLPWKPTKIAAAALAFQRSDNAMDVRVASTSGHSSVLPVNDAIIATAAISSQMERLSADMQSKLRKLNDEIAQPMDTWLTKTPMARRKLLDEFLIIIHPQTAAAASTSRGASAYPSTIRRPPIHDASIVNPHTEVLQALSKFCGTTVEIQLRRIRASTDDVVVAVNLPGERCFDLTKAPLPLFAVQDVFNNPKSESTVTKWLATAKITPDNVCGEIRQIVLKSLYRK